jgi:hypothetical protein
MKLYNKLGVIAAGLLMFTSCANHDLFTDVMDMGQVLPTVSWELGSSVCKAGDSVTFKGKYYTTAEGISIDHSEVWDQVTRKQSAAASVKLTSGLSYTKTVAQSDTMRTFQQCATFPHSAAAWDGYEYVLTGKFATSRTLGPVSWSSPSEWDETLFASYYPSNFASEFVATVVNYLTKDSAYVNDLKTVYVNYNFKKSQFEELNTKLGLTMPTDTDVVTKSENWFTNTAKVVGYYYITLDANGTQVIHEVAAATDVPAEYKAYEVYDSSPWIFCRYSDNTGGAITSVRAKYMPYWKALISEIPFKDWIYSTSDKVYVVDFTRSYSLEPQFKVFDTNGKVGTDTDTKTVDLN